LLAIHSALSAQKSESTAIASVVIHTFGRVIGNGLWNPLLLSCLPTEHFGAVYGISTLLTLPVQMVNIPFYEFITANPENGFASANYILVV